MWQTLCMCSMCFTSILSLNIHRYHERYTITYVTSVFMFFYSELFFKTHLYRCLQLQHINLQMPNYFPNFFWPVPFAFQMDEIPLFHMLAVFVLSDLYIFASLEVVIFLTNEIKHILKMLFGHLYFLFYEMPILNCYSFKLILEILHIMNI